MSKIINERDKRETLLKDQDLYLKNSIENDEVQRFIAEGIDEKMVILLYLFIYLFILLTSRPFFLDEKYES